MHHNTNRLRAKCKSRMDDAWYTYWTQWVAKENAQDLQGVETDECGERRDWERHALLQLEALTRFWKHQDWQHEGDESAFLEFVAHAVYHEMEFLPVLWGDPPEDPRRITRGQRHTLIGVEMSQWKYAGTVQMPLKAWRTWPDVFCDDPWDKFWAECKYTRDYHYDCLPSPWCQERHWKISCLATFPAPCRYRKEALELFWGLVVVHIGVPVELMEKVCECIVGGYENRPYMAWLDDGDSDSDDGDDGDSDNDDGDRFWKRDDADDDQFWRFLGDDHSTRGRCIRFGV